jgi:hypothetical protein
MGARRRLRDREDIFGYAYLASAASDAVEQKFPKWSSRTIDWVSGDAMNLAARSATDCSHRVGHGPRGCIFCQRHISHPCVSGTALK